MHCSKLLPQSDFVWEEQSRQLALHVCTASGQDQVSSGYCSSCDRLELRGIWAVQSPWNPFFPHQRGNLGSLRSAKPTEGLINFIKNPRNSWHEYPCARRPCRFNPQPSPLGDLSQTVFWSSSSYKPTLLALSLSLSLSRSLSLFVLRA